MGCLHSGPLFLCVQFRLDVQYSICKAQLHTLYFTLFVNGPVTMVSIYQGGLGPGNVCRRCRVVGAVLCYHGALGDGSVVLRIVSANDGWMLYGMYKSMMIDRVNDA